MYYFNVLKCISKYLKQLAICHGDYFRLYAALLFHDHIILHGEFSNKRSIILFEQKQMLLLLFRVHT